MQNDVGESSSGAWLKFPDGVSVVIGGSGGLGRAICQGFATAGCDIVFTYRSDFEAVKEVAALTEAQGRGAEFHQLSISDAMGSKLSIGFIGEVDSEEWGRVMDEDATWEKAAIGNTALKHFGRPEEVV